MLHKLSKRQVPFTKEGFIHGMSKTMKFVSREFTYTGAMEVAGPGVVDKVGNGVAAHYVGVSVEVAMQPTRRTAPTRSLLLLPAGKTATWDFATEGMGMTSEQSTSSRGLWPRVASLAMAFVNFVTMES